MYKAADSCELPINLISIRRVLPHCLFDGRSFMEIPLTYSVPSIRNIAAYYLHDPHYKYPISLSLANDLNKSFDLRDPQIESKPGHTLCLFFMARAGLFTKPNLLLLRWNREQAKRGKSGVSKVYGKAGGGGGGGGGGGEEERYEISSRGRGNAVGGGTTAVWVPHSRTGIYVPKGQEGVMEDVPENAATFTHTCWFRSDHDLNYPNP
ncbi:uncharacterized protein LOC129293094 [Prosopis cineraria]|uniref:uncharacterized protein LOC129293094 n=1 Tax=Prosopis cineraria TaxID=364024 RepID=UPI00240F0FE0|nr:uncharacterized protein LOC129293094 [Prosopis cineraria]